MLIYDAFTHTLPHIATTKTWALPLPLPQDLPYKGCCLLIRHRRTTMQNKCKNTEEWHLLGSDVIMQAECTFQELST